MRSRSSPRVRAARCATRRSPPRHRWRLGSGALAAGLGGDGVLVWMAALLGSAAVVRYTQAVLRATRDGSSRLVAQWERESAAKSRFVPRTLIDRLGYRSLAEVAIGDRATEPMTVLFADIRDSTGLTEKLSSEAAFALVAEFFARSAKVVHAHRGTVDKYLGDGYMALFPRRVEDALDAALALQREVAQMNREAAGPPIQIGVGLHTGPVTFGTVGDARQIDTTIVSDAVNTAKRVEGLSKRLDVPVVATEDVMHAVREPARYVDPVARAAAGARQARPARRVRGRLRGSAVGGRLGGHLENLGVIEPAASRQLGRGRPRSPAETLRALADELPPEAGPDAYGAGPLVEELEAEVAALLGKPAAVFSLSARRRSWPRCAPTPTPASAAGRVPPRRRPRRHVVAAHPRSHIVEDERDAIGSLYGLRVARVGALTDPFDADELGALHEPLAAVVVELPLRRAGYRVPPWAELVALGERTRAGGAAFHLDGARLWEAAPGYGRSPADVAALFDTVYVSFYKGLGGLAGGALAGDAATVAAAHGRRGPAVIERAGARPYRMYPYAVAARAGLRDELPRMPAYHAHAVELAAALDGLDGVVVSPNPPASNAFIVHLAGEHAALLAARDAVAASHGITAFAHLSRTAHPRSCSFELAVESATLAIPLDEARAAVAALVARAADEAPTSR